MAGKDTSDARIGWHYVDGRLVAVDTDVTDRFSRAVIRLRRAYLADLRRKGYLASPGDLDGEGGGDR